MNTPINCLSLCCDALSRVLPGWKLLSSHLMAFPNQQGCLQTTSEEIQATRGWSHRRQRNVGLGTTSKFFLVVRLVIKLKSLLPSHYQTLLARKPGVSDAQDDSRSAHKVECFVDPSPFLTTSDRPAVWCTWWVFISGSLQRRTSLRNVPSARSVKSGILGFLEFVYNIDHAWSGLKC